MSQEQNGNQKSNDLHKKGFFNKTWKAIVALGVILGIIASVITIKDCTNRQETEEIDSSVVIVDTNSIIITKPPKIEDKKPVEIITITETGTGLNYQEHEAEELAKVNALKNLKNNHGVIDTQIINRKFTTIKIDSLQDNIRATVEVSVKYKK